MFCVRKLLVVFTQVFKRSGFMSNLMKAIKCKYCFNLGNTKIENIVELCAIQLQAEDFTNF